jgi:serine/threonine protein kinase
MDTDDSGSSWIGQTLDGRYRVTRKLGRGGMGTVFLAEDEKMGRTVVIKRPEAHLLETPGFRERFELELKSLVGLTHPHIVHVHDGGRVGAIPYMVQEYLAGGSLDDRLEDAGGRLSLERIVRWLPDAAAALDHIHGLDIVHRDIKPGNIMFDEHGQVYLGDFGIAKALGSQDTGLTATGMTPGTPDYIAPEVALEQILSGAADQYALGSVVYRCVAGRVPVTGTSPISVVLNKLNEDAPPLAEAADGVSEEVSAVVMRALERKPDNRYPSCKAFAEAFVAAVGEMSTAASGSAPPTGVLPRPDAKPEQERDFPKTRIVAEGDRSEPPAARSAQEEEQDAIPKTRVVERGRSTEGRQDRWAPPSSVASPRRYGRPAGRGRCDRIPRHTGPRGMADPPGPRRPSGRGGVAGGGRQHPRAVSDAYVIWINGATHDVRIDPRDARDGQVYFGFDVNLRGDETKIEVRLLTEGGDLIDTETIAVVIDRTPPVIKVEGGLELEAEERIDVRGRVEDDHPGKHVLGNGRAYGLEDSAFTIPVDLEDQAEKTLEIVAKDKVGNESRVMVTVRRKPPPPAMEPSPEETSVEEETPDTKPELTAELLDGADGDLDADGFVVGSELYYLLILECRGPHAMSVRFTAKASGGVRLLGSAAFSDERGARDLGSVPCQESRKEWSLVLKPGERRHVRIPARAETASTNQAAAAYVTLRWRALDAARLPDEVELEPRGEMTIGETGWIEEK